ncbi:MAG: Crp/Fnr family transcriptional regulator [Oscillospiraceae bacterium]
MERNTVAEQAFALNKLFDGVAPIHTNLSIAAYCRGEHVSDTLDNIPCIGIVATGLVDVFSSACNESLLAVSTLGPGEAFGICNVFASHPMPTTLICRRAAKVVFISKKQFASLLSANHDMLMRYLILCNEKMQFLATRVELAGIPSCCGRLACYLLRNSDKDGCVFPISSKEQLSRMLGISRASLFRELGSLSRCGSIAVDDSSIRILDAERLRLAWQTSGRGTRKDEIKL